MLRLKDWSCQSNKVKKYQLLTDVMNVVRGNVVKFIFELWGKGGKGLLKHIEVLLWEKTSL